MRYSPQSSLSKYRVTARVYLPPILGENEIRKRRFGEMRIRRGGKVIIRKLKSINYNDRWWEWEEELGLEVDLSGALGERELHENSAPSKTANMGHLTKEEKVFEHRCRKCGHQWKDGEAPVACPRCRRRTWKLV